MSTIGVILFAAATAGDMVAHRLPAAATLQDGAHAATFVGMRIADEVTGKPAPGESITHDFEEAGTFSYDCSLHPQDMRGVVTVTQ